jgi:hypothetical protein
MMLPLSLKIIIGILLLLAISFLTLKKKRKFIWPLFALTIAVGIWKSIELYNKKNPDYSNVKADVKISAVNFIHEYEANDSSSNQKFLGKVVEVTGNIKEIKMDEKGSYTVILGDTNSMSSVRCSMDSVHQQDAAKLVSGSSTTVRGACTGFNKDEMGLGSDVILNRSVIIQRKN